MLEKFFGRKKDYYDDGLTEKEVEKKNIIGSDVGDETIGVVAHADSEGVRYFDVSKDNKKEKTGDQYVHNDKADILQDGLIAKWQVDEKKDEKYWKSGQDRDAEEKHWSIRNKVSNERNHPKLGEEHSDWKEKEPFALDLPEETIDEAHLNANAEINHSFEDGEHEDIDLERAA